MRRQAGRRVEATCAVLVVGTNVHPRAQLVISRRFKGGLVLHTAKAQGPFFFFLLDLRGMYAIAVLFEKAF